MEITQVFRNIIIAYWVLLLLSVAFSISLEPSLPEVLKNYLNTQNDIATSNSMLILYVGLLVLAIIATVGCWNFHEYGRNLWVFTLILSFAIPPYTEPVILNWAESVAAEFSILFEGFIICMLYYGPISEKFKNS